MPVFICRVADAQGKIEEFLREAASEEPLVMELSSRRLFVLSVREAEQPDRAGSRGVRFSRRVVEELTDLLTLMLGSGLSLKDSLDVAQTVSTRGPGRRLVALLLERIRKGSTFAGALDAAESSFPAVYRGMVKIGERIGSLDHVFSRLSAYLAEDRRLRDRLAAALLYPAIVLGVALMSAVLLVTVLLPRLGEIFTQLGPGMGARLESLMSSLTLSFVLLAASLAAGGLLGLGVARTRKKGGVAALRVDALLLRLPLVSSFLLQRELLNFSFAMEALTASGVSVEEALSEGAGVVRNAALRREIVQARERVMKGVHLSTALEHCELMPARVARWVGVGERVGHVEKVFMQLRAYYQQEVEKWIQRLMTLIEPAFIVVLGILVILFVVFFIVPIFSLYGNIL